MVLKVVL